MKLQSMSLTCSSGCKSKKPKTCFFIFFIFNSNAALYGSVADLREALNKPGAAGKAVVFSQLRDALAHADAALTWEGIGTESVGVRSCGAGGAREGQGMGRETNTCLEGFLFIFLDRFLPYASYRHRNRHAILIDSTPIV